MKKKYFSKTLIVMLFLGLFLISTKGISQTNLTKGDIAFTRINIDDETFSFVFLIPIASSTQFVITDEAWDGSNLLANESSIQFTTTSSFLAGEEISITATSLAFATTGSGTATLSSVGSIPPNAGNMFGAAGDNLFIYQSAAPPGANDFIAGINANSGVLGSPDNAWSTSASTSNSLLPNGLTNGTNALGIFPNGDPQSEVDNARYKSTSLRTGDKATLLAAIMNLTNWEYDNSIPFNPIGTSFTITGGNTTPVIAGTSASQAVNDNSTISPFSAITTTDADGDNLSATITLDDNAKGVLSGTGLTGTGPYNIASTTPADLQVKLRALSFNPSDNRSATSETTTFTVVVNDATDTDTDVTTTVVSSAVAPSITSVGATTANGNYKAGDNVIITITFDEIVTVTGTPQLTLETGITDRTINYNGTGSGSTTLQFAYSVQAGDVSSDLDYLATNSLTAGTSIQDAGGKYVSLTLATPGSTNSLGFNKAITIDTTAPTNPTIVTQSTNDTTPIITGTNALASAFPVGETMTVTVNGATYNVVPDASGNWSVDTGVATPTAGTLGTFVNGVSYEVVATVTDLASNNTSDATNNEVTIDTSAPLISSITRQSPVTSTTDADALAWDVTFNGIVVNVNTIDFTVSGTTATIASVTNPSGNVYRVTVSGGDLASLNATVTLGFAGGQNISDASGNALTNLTPTGTNNNTFVVDNTPPVYTWTGAFNSTWNITLNWNPTIVPPTNADIIIPGGLTNYPTASSAVTCNSLTIESGATFIPQSTVTGSIIYKRNLPTTNWSLVTSPIANETLENVITNNTFATGTASNIGISTYANSGASPWTYFNTGSTGNIIPGMGLSVKLATAGELSSTGTALNTSNVIFGVSTGTRTNFNLLGNPFTAYINSGTFTTTNTGVLTEDTIWLWNGTVYETYNATTPIEIAPGQAFFIEASTNGAIIFTTSNRSHQNTDTFKRPATKQSFELFVENNADKKSTKVFYIADKTTGFDNGYDSKMFTDTTSNFDVFTELISDNKGNKLAIQTLPTSKIEEMIIPVGLTAKSGKEVTFSVNTQNLPADVKIYLEDRKTNTFTNISEKSHKIVLENQAKGTGQFYIHTTSKDLEIASIPENLQEDLQKINIFKSANNSVTITGLQNKNTSVNVFSMLGKKVISKQFKATGVHVIQLPKTAKGVYIVELTSNSEKITKKIILE
ncbi:T9SS type A sorting domain-containing protein [Tenacibaculum finnmarkense]|uniref:T9SS type A sorting domain-containing protein n=1 Tax=Tenacibaculum finnmarkense TaxID=2781243 RepID=UPI001E4A05FD|nr:T9SS type A sorting domain-containing protein [Tenacibaculum finnmarkense]MCD8445811.1 T9SS type A sorting domain-containing protein [Tenacibaculum finnmarkense genomovar finnmarkense]